MTARRTMNMSELAQLAGVSVSTVSRALAGNTLINQTTRNRITVLAQELGFQPNMRGRNLRLNRTDAIGVILPLGHQTDQHLTDPFFLTLIGYLADELSDRGYDMLLKKVVPADDLWLQQFVASGRVDGVIVIGQSNQAEAIDRVARSFLSMVVWGAALPGQHYVSVGSDNVSGGALATRHLVDRGCRNLLFLGDSDAPEIGQREIGFRRTCAEAGLESSAHSVRVGLVAETAYQELLGILDSEVEVDGIVAASDVIAIAAIRALEVRGRRVPTDVAVIGYDDVPMAAHLTPQLTTVRQDLAQGAQLLVQKLFELIEGRRAISAQMVPMLMVRETA